MRTLADFLEEYEGPLTADFQRVYGLRLVSAVEERTTEEITDLIEWLPTGCAFHASMEAKGDTRAARRLFEWDTSKELLLGALNTIRHQSYVIAQVQSPKKIAVPKSVPGPRDKKSSGDKTDMNAIARAFMQAQGG